MDIIFDNIVNIKIDNSQSKLFDQFCLYPICGIFILNKSNIYKNIYIRVFPRY